MFKTVGGIREEDIEQILNIFNRILTNLLCVREKAAQLTISMERIEVRTKTTGEIGREEKLSLQELQSRKTLCCSNQWHLSTMWICQIKTIKKTILLCKTLI